ncbi:mitochondrial 54S ribosomal protein uL5m [Limtongia smithiae]|uniref:mitochondrial 54S ribosomal protein uL5m n=1 Tax=Limtongia smithiae TaxID=1125753 RepID=UPI0034CD5B1F
MFLARTTVSAVAALTLRCRGAASVTSATATITTAIPTMVSSKTTPSHKRAFHTTPTTHKSPVSIVPAVHHRIRYKKSLLHPRYRKLLMTPKWDPRSHYFKPQATQPSRLQAHFDHTIAGDLMLANYRHGETRLRGRRTQEWDGSSPYHLNRPLRAPAGSAVATPDIHPRTYKNVPFLTAIYVNTFVRRAVEQDPERALPTLIAMQQITGKKPTPAYSRVTVQQWRLRKRILVGGKVRITGQKMHQLFATLVELVLPRLKDFKGINNSSGDKFGNISFGLEPEDIRLFPEIEGNSALWPALAGMHFTFVTSAQTDPEARTLLSALGVPFQGRERFHNVPSADGPKQTRKKGIVYYENSQE